MAPTCLLNQGQTHCGTHGPPAYLSRFIGRWYCICVELNDSGRKDGAECKSPPEVLFTLVLFTSSSLGG